MWSLKGALAVKQASFSYSMPPGFPRRTLRFSLSLTLAAWLGVGAAIDTARGQASDKTGEFAELVRLEYETSVEGCPNKAELQRAVRRRLGFDPFASDDAKHTLSVAIYPGQEGLSARLKMRDALGTPLGHRVLETDESECDQLLESVALAASLAIRPPDWGTELMPEQAERGVEDRRSLQAPAPVEAEAEPRATERGAAATQDDSRLKLGVSLGPALSVNLLPNPKPAGILAASLQVEDWQTGLVVAGWLPTQTEGPAAFRAWLGWGAVQSCFVGWPVQPCGGVGVGVFAVRGVDVDVVRSASSFYPFITGGMAARLLHAGPVDVHADLMAVVPIVRPFVRVDGEIRWRGPHAGGLTAVRVGFQL